jgi:5-methylcytosine-specific restriction protein A
VKRISGQRSVRSARVYDTARWRRLRLLKLAHNPLCQECKRLNLLTIATTIHHLVDISKGGPPLPTLDQLQSLCKRCHDEITNARQRGVERVAKGCDADGLPLDRDHPFYRG